MSPDLPDNCQSWRLKKLLLLLLLLLPLLLLLFSSGPPKLSSWPCGAVVVCELASLSLLSGVQSSRSVCMSGALDVDMSPHEGVEGAPCQP